MTVNLTLLLYSIYGINECDKGTPKNVHSGHDFSGVIENVTKINENISPLSIRDLHRLGKYQEESRHPRLLVKLQSH